MGNEQKGSLSLFRRVRTVLLGFLTLAFFIVAVAPLLLIIWTAWDKGKSALNWSFVSTLPTGFPVGSQGGILNGIVGSIILVIVASSLSVPAGIWAGMYLWEEGTTPLARLIRLLSDLLLGVPSVVWGVVGFYVFSTSTGYGLHWGFSAMAGGLTLGFIMIPIVTRVTEQALRDVPLTFIEGSFALGASRWQTLKSIAIPAAMAGIGTGILLGVLNVLGQTAPLIFTNYYNTGVPSSLVGSQGAVGDLAMQIFIYIHEPSEILHTKAMAASLVLLGIVLFIDIGIRLMTWGSRKLYARVG